ncbi:MAG: MFS transporter [Thaumarchaeota archaeon]|nr:MFS transporter [Nitrososphaerota archaeon]
MEEPASLVRDPDFMKFWVGQSISVFGAQFSPLAIGFIAVKILDASDTQLGYLAFFNTIPFLTIGLLVGVWADRHRRRRIMLMADFGRAAVLFSIPFAAVFYALSMNLIYLVTLLAGILTVFFEIDYQSYVPSLVQKSQIVEANSKMETSRSTAQAVGPSAAGFVVNKFWAPLAILGDTIGYLASSFSLLLIRHPETVPEATVKRSTWHDIREGLGIVFGDKRLKAIAATTATSNLFSSAWGAILIKYMLDDLHMSIGEIGLAGGIGSLGGILGALTASRVMKGLGVGRTILLGISLSFVSVVLYFIPPQSVADANALYVPSPAFFLVTASTFVLSIGVLLYNIPQVSYRQALVPKEVQGRMNATMRTLVWGTLPIGSLLGGASGDLIGTQETIGLMAALGSLAFLWILFSPVRGVKEFPHG